MNTAPMPPLEPSILYVENDPVWLKRLPSRIHEALRRSGLSGSKVRTSDSYEEAHRLLTDLENWDLLVTDIGLADDDKVLDTRGMELVSIARRRKIPCLVVTGTEDISTKDVRDLILDYKVCDVFDKLRLSDEDFISTVQKALSVLPVVGETRRAIKLFFSYSHKDESRLEDLRTHLAILTHQGYLSTWCDRAMLTGQNIDDEIKTHMENSDIICLLISSDFLASYYCLEVEMERALARHGTGQSHLIPVILRPCEWTATRLKELLALPTDGKPVTRWGNRDTAWMDVARGIRRVVDQLRDPGKLLRSAV